MNRYNAFTAIFAFSLPLATQAGIEPVIDQVVRLSNGSGQISIYGSYFGHRPTDFISFFDRVSNISTYDKLSPGDIIPVDKGEPWSQNGNPWSLPIVLAAADSERGAAYKGKSQSALGWPVALLGAQNSQLYVSWWIKPSHALSKDGGPNKLIRIWDDPGGKYTRISWTTNLLGYSYDNNWAPTKWHNWDGKTGAWNHMEITVDGTNHTIKALTNNSAIHSAANFMKSERTSLGLNVGQIGFDPRESSSFSDLEFLMTDIYVATSPARVEVSNSPTWKTGEEPFEVQQVIEWTPNHIAFELGIEMVSSEEPIFLYIVNPNGDANRHGYPLSCPTCPNSPEVLSIQ